MASMYFEDFEPGQVFETEGHTLSEAEIMAYGRQYDPQPFHVDKEAAAASMYGGLIASGWHVNSIAWRLFLELGLIAESSEGSPGLIDVRWRAPVRPGDTVRVKGYVDAVRPSRTAAHRGNVVMRWEILNQRDEVVTSYGSVQLVRKRDPQS